MAKYGPTLKVSPLRWFGISFGFNDTMFNFMKELPCKAFDKETKTWWFPEGSLGIVLLQAVQVGCVTEDAAAKFEAEAKAPKKEVRTDNDALQILGLLPGAPEMLVEAAYGYWSREWLKIGGAMDKITEVEEAYRFLKQQYAGA